MTLKKLHIIELIQKKLELTGAESYKIVENLVEIIKRTLESGDDVMISGFGKFNVKEKKIRRGRNPATGEDMMLDARRVVTFICSGPLRNKINDKTK